MPWTKEEFPDSMKNLKDEIRDKAIEIANKLVEDGYEDDRAIPIAISQSKEWYDRRSGEISTDITHHLTPHENGWLLKSKDDSERHVFETKVSAMKRIKEISEERAIKVMIHDSDGKFQEVY